MCEVLRESIVRDGNDKTDHLFLECTQGQANAFLRANHHVRCDYVVVLYNPRQSFAVRCNLASYFTPIHRRAIRVAKLHAKKPRLKISNQTKLRIPGRNDRSLGRVSEIKERL